MTDTLGSQTLLHAIPPEYCEDHHISLPKRFIKRNATFRERIAAGLIWPDALRMTGSVIPRIILPVLLLTLWSAVLCTIHFLSFNIAVSSYILLALSMVVGPIVAFYTNAAYERFREGRQAICEMVIALRSMRQLLSCYGVTATSEPSAMSTFPPPPASTTRVHEARALVESGIKLLPAIFVATKRRLRRDFQSDQVAATAEDADHYEWILQKVMAETGCSETNLPLVLIEQLTKIVARLNGLKGTPAVLMSVRMVGAYSNLERILSTPIP